MPDDPTTKLLDEVTSLADGGRRPARGGYRPGSGRRQGKIRRLTEAAILEAQESGELPLDYMLRVMRDETATDERRDMMAIAAAPYMHARLLPPGPPLAKYAAGPMVGNLVVMVGGEGAAATDATESITITPPLAVEGEIIENADHLLAGDGPPGPPPER
jgi:hypothetical protein